MQPWQQGVLNNQYMRVRAGVRVYVCACMRACRQGNKKGCCCYGDAIRVYDVISIRVYDVISILRILMHILHSNTAPYGDKKRPILTLCEVKLFFNDAFQLPWPSDIIKFSLNYQQDKLGISANHFSDLFSLLNLL